MGNCGDFGVGPDLISARRRIQSRIRSSQFWRIGRGLRTNTIFGLQNTRPSSHHLRDESSFLPPPAYDCTSLVHLVRDYMRLNDRTRSGSGPTEAIKSKRHTSARRIQHRNEREQRVLAGKSLSHARLAMPFMQGEWYSTFRGRNTAHLRHCKRN